MIMSSYRLGFKANTASVSEIVSHLQKCDGCFTPPLHTYVNIKQYSEKLWNYAANFEAWDNGQLVGLVSGYFNKDDERTGFISNVSILPEYHGRGIAYRLVMDAIDYGKRKEYSRIDLEVSALNIPAQKLYRKCGFIASAEVEQKIVMSCFMSGSITA
jgi:ribosomal protein S18 acetylase RimI-like enzyme